MVKHKDWKTLTALYHELHPEVYVELVKFAHQAKEEKGMKTVGIELLVNLLRWDKQIGLNQNFAAHYARMIMDNEPEFEGFFNLRKRDWQSDLEQIGA